MPTSSREPYLVHSVVHAAQILGAFASPGEVLRLRDVVARTRLSKGMCFRLLHTLHHCGLLDKVDASGFRLVSEIRRRKRYRIGYASQGGDTSFEREVHSSLQARSRARGRRADRGQQPIPAHGWPSATPSSSCASAWTS